MTRRTSIPSGPFRTFLTILGIDLAIAMLLWATSFGLFLAFTLPMDNQFAAYAREHHAFEAVLTNLRTLPGYGILAIVYALLAWPFLRRRRAFAEQRRLRCFLLVAGANLVFLFASLGFVAVENPGFIDFLARHLGPVFPEFDFYLLYDLHVPEILIGLLAVIGGIAGARYLMLLPRRLAAAGVLAALGILVLALIPGGRAAQERTRASRGDELPNILVIASDSLRADHLGCYGYARETSPNIDRLAGEGMLFESLHVSSASTLESWTSFLTAQFPVTHGLRYMFPSRERVSAVERNPDTLPKALARAGYHTVVSSNWAGNCFKLVDFGFAANHASDVQNLDVFVAEATLIAHWIYPLFFSNRVGEAIFPELRQITSYMNPEALTTRLFDEVSAAREMGKPFFGVLFTSTTHLPFAASYPHNVRFVDRSYRGPNRYQIDFEVDGFIQNGFRDALGPADVQHVIDLYDGAVAEFDALVGEVLEELERRDLDRSTIVIVTSDHGDDLYDPGTTLGHGTNFFGGDQCTRIPWVMRLPGRAFAGRHLEQLVRNVDLAPMLLELAGAGEIPSSWEGQSCLEAIRNPQHDPGRPAFAETCYLFFPKKGHPPGARTIRPADQTLMIDPAFRNNLVLREPYHDDVIATKDRMVRTPRWKLIHIPGERGPIYRLYDMERDPEQQHDLSGEGLPVQRRLAALLDAYWSGRTDLRWTREDDEAMR